jgi:hypothetical protein
LRSYKGIARRSVWKGAPEKVTARYPKAKALLREVSQSSAELVELRVKQGGPPSKAKYYSTTDSVLVG